MRFIHIADVHLGAKPEAGKLYSYNREREIWDTFGKVLDVCEKEQIPLLLIAGDLFHRQPLLRELKEVDYLFSRLTVTKVVFIAGNHDYIKENSYYGSFVWSDNVYPILSSSIDCVEIEELDVAVFGCSYHQREILDNRLEEIIELTNKQYNILIGHGGDANHMPFSIPNMKKTEYDYIALGHIHKSEILIHHKMAYAGALEPTDIADIGKHGYILGELQEEGAELTFIPIAGREYIQKQIQISPEMTQYELKDLLVNIRQELGQQNLYIFELVGRYNPENVWRIEELDELGNVVKIVNNTKVNYDIEQLGCINQDNLLGAYIRSYGAVEEGSIEFMALCMGIEAIEETKKG